jgi:hypothetical protein
VTNGLELAHHVRLQVVSRPDTLESAILKTVAYADVFDYPLRAEEIQRYLIGVQATQEEVDAVLNDGSVQILQLRFTQGYYTLANREGLVRLRQKREQIASRRWPVALRYGKWIAALPYVRMVAVTGALAMSNEEGADLDYLVVTANGRLWLCRAMVMILVRMARRFGDEICPNYFLAESALRLEEKNLYTAHEMAQMVPLSGLKVYQRMRELNAWMFAYLPNAAGAPLSVSLAARPERAISPIRNWVEKMLNCPQGQWIEEWEMHRKVRKLRAQETLGAETDFCPERCKGHFGGYGRKTQQAYLARLQVLGLEDGIWELL